MRAQLLSDLNKTVVVTGVQRHAGVQGMGGIGKTVLASAVVRDCVIRRSYNDGVYWITIGQNPQLLSVQSQLGEMLEDSAHNLCNLEDGKCCLNTLLGDKRALLILGDIWEVEHVKAFNALGTKCRMLITTRNAEPLKMFGIEEYTLDVLGEGEALADGRLLLLADDNTLRLWDLRTYRQLAAFYGNAPIICYTVMADGETIAAGDNVGRVLFLRYTGG